MHQVFWVVRTSGEISLFREEADFYRQRLRDCCDDLVVTGAEHLESEHRDQFARFYRDNLGVHFLRFHFVSGKQVYTAKRNGDASLLNRSVLRDLEARLTKVADATTRLTRLSGEVLNLTEDFGAWLSQSDAGLEREQRWDCVKVEWLNVLHQAGKFEANGGETFKGWRDSILRTLQGESR